MSDTVCRRSDHRISRRLFLHGAGGGLALGGCAAGGFGRLFAADHAEKVKTQAKHVILLFMSGGPSQFETWDPKTGRPTGGPHLSIPTTVPGVRFDEYMPNLARLANKTATVRSMTSDLGDHMEAHYLAQTGHKPTAAIAPPPHWLSAAAHLQPAAGGLPSYVALGAEQGGNMAVPGPGFLGPAAQALYCPGKGQGPEDLPTGGGAKDLADFRRRDGLRQTLGKSFDHARGTDATAGHAGAFAAVDRLLANRDLFDLSKEPAKRIERYGPTALGKDTLLAARLVEKGVPFVRVQHQNGLAWDKHRQAFDSQRHITREFDTVAGALIDDLIDRGLWDTTLVIMMGEFGRTPEILGQGPPGRNHWTKSWSLSFGGCGVRPAVVGRTNDDGTAVADRPVNIPDLFATFYTLLGINYKTELEYEGRPVPLTENGKGTPIKEVL